MPRARALRRALSPLALLVALSACASSEGVRVDTLESAAEGREMTYSVYTPPGWDGEQALPLVVFLHGGGDDGRVLEDKAAVARTFDAWIEAGDLDPFIMVAPDGERGLWITLSSFNPDEHYGQSLQRRTRR